MSNQIEILKKRLTLGSLPESAKARIQAQIDQLEAESKGAEESATKQQEKLEKEENKAEADVDDNIEKLKKRLTLGSLPEKAKERIRQQIEDAEKLKSEAKKERAEEKKEAEKKEAEVKAKVKEAVEKVKKVVKEAPKKVSAEKTPAKAKAVEKKVEKEVKKEIEKAKTEVKKAKVEGKKAEAKKAEGAKKRKKKFDKMLTDLQRLINKDKKLKALYGADNPSDLKRDAGRMAKPFGWRYKGEHNYKVPPKSERGNDNTYYEGRPEKADLRRRTYPYLEMGGDVMSRDSYGNYYTVQIQTMTNGFNEEVKKFGDIDDAVKAYEQALKSKDLIKVMLKVKNDEGDYIILARSDEDSKEQGVYFSVIVQLVVNGELREKVYPNLEIEQANEIYEGFKKQKSLKVVLKVTDKEGNSLILERSDEDKFANGGMTTRNNWVNYAAKYYTVQTQFVNSNGKFESTTNKYEDFNSAKKAYENALSKKSLIKVMLKGHNYTGIDVEIDENDYNMMNYPEYVIVMDSSDKMAKGGMMARGGEVSEIKMYYHQTSGGAEYLCSEKVEGTKGEGSFKSKYVVRLDGATDGSKMIIKDNDKVKTIKMYYHETSGGAEYLCSEKVEGTKGEGSFNSKYVVRLDGATDGSEMIIKSGKFEDGGMMANGGEIREGKFQAMFYTNEDDGYHIDSEYFDVYPSESDIEYLAKSLNSKYVEIYEDRHNDDSYTFLEETYFIDEEYKLGGMFGKSRYNTGRSWHLDRARHNKREDYEIPMPNRKGAKKVSSSKSSAASKSAPKRAKTGKYAKASRSSASASSSRRGYNYIPNSQIKSITTVDDKVITKKKILDGAYVRKKNGGMM
jgi:flagellar motor protein MotB